MAGISIATAAKKALEAVASNKKGRNFLLWVVGIAVGVLLVPVVVLVGLFGWMNSDRAIELDRTSIVSEMSIENQDEIEYIDSVCNTIVNTFKTKGLDTTIQKKAQAIYISALRGYEINDNFYSDYADCFLNATSEKNEFDLIYEKFSVTISEEDQAKLEKLYAKGD